MKEAFLAAKERWAQKMAGKEKAAVRSVNRLPPGQHQVSDFPVLVTHHCNGQPLSKDHGGPARLILPKRYAWKGAKWLKEIVFLDHDVRGYWEVRGYSNTADPWTNDRFG